MVNAALVTSCRKDPMSLTGSKAGWVVLAIRGCQGTYQVIKNYCGFRIEKADPTGRPDDAKVIGAGP